MEGIKIRTVDGVTASQNSQIPLWNVSRDSGLPQPSAHCSKETLLSSVLPSKHCNWMLQKKTSKKLVIHWTVGTEREFLDVL